MNTILMPYVCLAFGLSAALVAGVFQSFSDFIMKALVATKPAGGAEAMQHINQTVFRSVFLVMMLGLAPLTMGLAAYAYYHLDGARQAWIIAGAIVYATSVFGVTMLGNVPMNNRLAKLDAALEETTPYWRTYGVQWTRWNHVRTLGSLATAACFLLASVGA